MTFAENLYLTGKVFFNINENYTERQQTRAKATDQAQAVCTPI